MTASISVGLGILVLLLSFGAAAQPEAKGQLSGDCQASPDCAKELAAGVNDYQQHHYETAQATFQRAYSLSNDPRVLVLLGRTYFKRGDSRGALELYERALPQITNPADRAKLEQYLAEARKKNDTPESTPPADSTLTKGPADLTAPPPPPPPPAKEKKTKVWVFVVVGVAAAAVVGTAVGLGVHYGTASPTPDKTITFP